MQLANFGKHQQATHLCTVSTFTLWTFKQRTLATFRPSQPESPFRSCERKDHVNSLFLFSFISLLLVHSCMFVKGVVFSYNFGFLNESIRSTPHWRFEKWKTEAATERSFQFRLPKSCKEEVSLLDRSKMIKTDFGLVLSSLFSRLKTLIKYSPSFLKY